MATKRQLLISELRGALNKLETPVKKGQEGGYIEFEVGGTVFELENKLLDKPLREDGSGVIFEHDNVLQ